jgi:hypothetical protein
MTLVQDRPSRLSINQEAGPSLDEFHRPIRDLNGRLFSFGFFELLTRLKFREVAMAQMPRTGVGKELRATPIGPAAAISVNHSLRKYHEASGSPRGRLFWILQGNLPVRQLIETLASIHTGPMESWAKAPSR